MLEVRNARRSPQSVQADIETVHGLTVAALDRMHRLIRLARHVPWSMPELDRAIASVGGQLDRAGFVAIAEIVSLTRHRARTVDQARSIVGALAAGDPLLAERFAASGLVDPQAMFVHPGLCTNPPPSVDLRIGALASALTLPVAALEGTIRALAPALVRDNGAPAVPMTGFDPSDPDESQRGFTLSERNLAILVRHIEVARAAATTVVELRAWAATTPRRGGVAAAWRSGRARAARARRLGEARWLDRVVVAGRARRADRER